MIISYRQRSWASRALPDFLMIGAMKAGSTSMFNYLSQHPQLTPACMKEIHYFDGGGRSAVDYYERGEAWYRAHFPLIDEIGEHSLTFEATPVYIYNPLVPKRIFDLVPDAKLIAVLRNPTERAISHYLHEKRLGGEPLSIYEALQAEEARLEPAISRRDYRDWIYVHYSYKKRGLYREQLEKYLALFPRSQVLIVDSDDLFNDPDRTLSRVFDFLGVDVEFKARNLQPRNVATNRTEIDQEVYNYLDEYFLPHNEALYELIGEQFRW